MSYKTNYNVGENVICKKGLRHGSICRITSIDNDGAFLYFPSGDEIYSPFEWIEKVKIPRPRLVPSEDEGVCSRFSPLLEE